VKEEQKQEYKQKYALAKQKGVKFLAYLFSW